MNPNFVYWGNSNFLAMPFGNQQRTINQFWISNMKYLMQCLESIITSAMIYCTILKMLNLIDIEIDGAVII